MSAKSRPDRRRTTRAAANKAGTRARPAPARRPAPKAPSAHSKGGGMLNTLIIALLVVLAVMIAVFLLVIVRVVG